MVSEIGWHLGRAGMGQIGWCRDHGPSAARDLSRHRAGVGQTGGDIVIDLEDPRAARPLQVALGVGAPAQSFEVRARVLAQFIRRPEQQRLDLEAHPAQQPRRDMTKTMRIGLAWMTTDKGIVWHNGGTGGYRSFLGFAPDRKRGLIVLTNAAVEADDLGFAVLDADAPLAPAYKANVAGGTAFESSKRAP